MRVIVRAMKMGPAGEAHCTARYLQQAGVKTEYIRLQDKGIHGNGHMVTIEKNNLDIAHVIDEWIVKNVK